MTAITLKVQQIFKCAECGNMVEIMHVGGGTLACCNQPMQSLVENTVDAAREKHIPVIEKTATGVIVRVGSVAHPMEDKHYIEWIEVIADGKSYRQNLQSGDAPEATFALSAMDISARAYCNLHGLWKGETE